MLSCFKRVKNNRVRIRISSDCCKTITLHVEEHKAQRIIDILEEIKKEGI